MGFAGGEPMVGYMDNGKLNLTKLVNMCFYVYIIYFHMKLYTIKDAN